MGRPGRDACPELESRSGGRWRPAFAASRRPAPADASGLWVDRKPWRVSGSLFPRRTPLRPPPPCCAQRVRSSLRRTLSRPPLRSLSGSLREPTARRRGRRRWRRAATKNQSDRRLRYFTAASFTCSIVASSTVSRSARRETVRQRWRCAASGEPPGRMKDRSGWSRAFIASISASSRVHLAFDHAQRRVGGLGVLLHLGAAEVRAEVEEVVLDHGELRVQFARPREGARGPRSSSPRPRCHRPARAARASPPARRCRARFRPRRRSSCRSC
jgi:hypothetical protein